MFSLEKSRKTFSVPEAEDKKINLNFDDEYFVYEKAIANALGVSPRVVRLVEKIGALVAGVSAALVNSAPVEAKPADIFHDGLEPSLTEYIPAMVMDEEIPDSVMQLRVNNSDDQQRTELTTAEKLFLVDHPIKGLDTSKNYVALTYDDWPANPKQLETILNVAKEKNIHVTFFISGKQFQWLVTGKLKDYGWNDDSLIWRMIHEGHQIGYHGGDHTLMTTLSNEALKKDVELFLKTFREKYDYVPTIYRPPYGGSNDRVRTVFADYGMQEVVWSNGGESGGFVKKDTEKTVTEAISKIPGIIILSHMQREGDVEAMDKIVDYCVKNHFLPVTIDQGRSPSDTYK